MNSKMEAEFKVIVGNKYLEKGVSYKIHKGEVLGSNWNEGSPLENKEEAEDVFCMLGVEIIWI